MDEPQIKFRKSALQYFSAINNLGKPTNTITTKSWILMLSIGLIILATILWGFLGKIPTYVIGRGILVEEGSSIYTANVASLISGTAYIKKIMVKSGDKVYKGQVVASLDDSALRSKVTVKTNYVAYLQKEYQELSQDFKAKNKVYQANIKRHNQVLNNIITAKTKYLAFLDTLLKDKQKLLAKGFGTKLSVGDTMEDYHETKHILEQTRLSLVQNKINADNFVDRWHERLRDLALKILSAKNELSELQKQLETQTSVYSPVDGTVVGILGSLGGAMDAGNAVVSIATSGHGMDALVYFSSKETKRVKNNMAALISPDMIKREEYGSIKGTVIVTSTYPAAEEAMMAVLHNRDLVKTFLKEGVPIEVRVRLQKNQKNYSGLQWTSSKGPPQKITPGSLVIARIIVRQQPPISLVIPAFKKLLRIE